MKMKLIKIIKEKIKRDPFLFKVAKSAYKDILAFYHLIQGDSNYFKCYLAARLRLKKSLGKPILLTIEPTNACNLRCPVCETGSGTLGRKKRMLSFDQFKYILDQFDDNLKMLLFYFMGEPFLNKDAYKMIRYAADRGLFISTCTNGEYVDPEKVVKSGIADLQFQIGGTTQDTHKIYRIGGDLSKTLTNLKEIIALKKKYAKELKREKYPLRVTLGFIVMKHNEHQVDEFIKLAEDLGVDRYEIVKPAVRDVVQGKEFLTKNKYYWIYDEKAFSEGKLKIKNPPHNYCEWIYSTVNGDVVLCCRDPEGKYILGNIFKERINDIWNSEKYQKYRSIVGKNQKNFSLCSLCEGYGIPDMSYLEKKLYAKKEIN